MKWVTAYGASQCGNYMYKMKVAQRTFRTFVRLPFGGEKVRLVLSAMYGCPLSIGEMTITAGGETKTVLVKGEESFEIKKNSHFCSDEIDLSIPDGAEAEIRTFFSKGECMSGLWQATTYSALGNFTEGEFVESKDDLWAKKKRPFDIGIPFPAVAGIDVYTEHEDAKAVAIFGASNEFIGRWVEPLRKKVNEQIPHVSLLNVSISGDRLLKDTGNKLLLGNLFGDSGLKRFDWDIKGFSGIDTIVCCVGANDIHQPGSFACYPWEKLPTAEMLQNGYVELIKKARQAGIKVIGTTVSPLKNGLKYTEEKMALRRKINEWILESGTFDAVFDLAKVIVDPSDPDKMNEPFNSGDYVHFNEEGGKAIAKAFPLDLIR